MKDRKHSEKKRGELLVYKLILDLWSGYETEFIFEVRVCFLSLLFLNLTKLLLIYRSTHNFLPKISTCSIEGGDKSEKKLSGNVEKAWNNEILE